MKKLTTYYFLLLAWLNVFFAQYLPNAAAFYENFYRNSLLGGQPLPLWTELVCTYPWWPWVGVAICVVGTMLSLLGRPKDNVLKNLLIALLIVELGIMIFTMMAFHVSLYGQQIKYYLPKVG